MAVTAEALRNTLRQWTSGVVVFTTATRDQRAGVTVSSFTSVSLEPPLVLVCLQKPIYPLQLVREAGVFAASLLHAGQSNVSAQFAGFAPLPAGEDRFYGIETFTAVTGAPILTDSLAWLDCRIHAIYEGGGSEIVVGEVLATDHQPDVPPLTYHNRSYFQLVPEKT